MSDDFLRPGDEAMIAGALAEARAAGVAETTIERVVAEELELRDGFIAPILSARLGYLARAGAPAGSAGDSRFTAGREPDP